MNIKRKAKQNAWGNWNGYVGRKKVIEFGTDDVRAGHWVLTGEEKGNNGYSSAETVKASRAALS